MTPLLWPHQIEGRDFARPKPASMINGGMGTGKSGIEGHLLLDWGCRRTLIVCPPSVRNVWRRELPRHCGDVIRPIILDHGSIAERTAQADAALCDPSPAAIVVNIEASWREPFARWALSRRWDCVVYDEAHGIKTEGSACSEMAARLTPLSGHRNCLTGTPLAHQPLDAWGQYRFLDPTIFGTDYGEYLARYAAPRQMRRRKRLRAAHHAMADGIAALFGPDSPLLSEWGDCPDYTQWLPGLRNAAEFEERIAPITWRCKSSDVLDLPPLIQDERTVELGPAARRAYDQLETELYADIGAGVPINSRLTLWTRLQQLTSGFLPDRDETCHHIDTAKRDALYDLLAEAGERVVVFCRFTPDLDTAESVARSLGLRYAELSGRRKDAMTDMATLAPGTDVTGVQVQSGGQGIDLSAAPIGIWYSLPRPLWQYDQGASRLHRPGTTGTRMYQLIAADTIDEDIRDSIRDHREITEGVLDRMSRRIRSRHHAPC